MIKEYFINYFYHNSDLSIDLGNNNIEVLDSNSENFKVTLVDTGLNTNTAGRLKRVERFIDGDNFMLTYGDGLANIDLKELERFHSEHGKIATVTSVQPEGRFGGMEFGPNDEVRDFKEKPKGDGHWINGGFFVLNKKVFNYIDENSDAVMWEQKPLVSLTDDNELHAYKHEGFWRCMDALRDKVVLEELWRSNKAEWKTW
jgi:glucose-1-phosphate cytidylyltransferase